MTLNNTAVAAIFEALMNESHPQHQQARQMAEQFVNEQRAQQQEELRQMVVNQGYYSSNND